MSDKGCDNLGEGVKIFKFSCTTENILEGLFRTIMGVKVF